MAIRAALFDMDGTIYDSNIDWLALRAEIKIPWDGRPILAQLADTDEETRARGAAALHRVEAEGARNGALIEGTPELLSTLREHGTRCALVTNNSRASAETVLSRYDLSFEVVLTREDGRAKPDPHLFLLALDRLGVAPQDALVIGDAHLDAIAAQAAGVPRVVLVGTSEWMREHLPEDSRHHEAADLHHVREIVLRLLGDGA